MSDKIILVSYKSKTILYAIFDYKILYFVRIRKTFIDKQVLLIVFLTKDTLIVPDIPKALTVNTI